jgi:hypothetical protein
MALSDRAKRLIEISVQMPAVGVVIFVIVQQQQQLEHVLNALILMSRACQVP